MLLLEEATKARAHFQIWWTLRNLALPHYYDVMNDARFVKFFEASSSGHYTQFMLALAKIFDRDTRVAGVSELKRALRAEGQAGTAIRIARRLNPVEPHVRTVMGIRDRSLVHNEQGMSRQAVYRVRGVTPNQLRGVIDAACDAIDDASISLGLGHVVFGTDAAERATLGLLEALKRGSSIG